ncbi:PREDICTED: short-chain dehydrogenase/reductase family 16C member 6-like [Drosophila arizonae]|uniref:Short-chain dehydrogenase/reductase family 16C member 6-like n=1 Tax=Drosophila arizonae TaxID=7263 RepID=A0ABM1NUP4_DROAR|nr:PREDICTED: short-chain dehydrogenase/reductase family 16C member 6-like [Drosophila arizonae]
MEIIRTMLRSLVSKQLKDISKDTVLITGTGHGIGKELALLYAGYGSTVICVDINEKNNVKTVQEVKHLNRGVVYSFGCDVSKRDQVVELATRVHKNVGPVSVLINNAGIMPTHPLTQQTPEEILRVFDVNVFSQFWTIQSFLDQMKKQRKGHIIAMSSVAGLFGLPNLVPYCATKFAVRGLMEALYEEIRKGPYKNQINLTTIYPYMTNTGLCKNPKIRFPSIWGLLDPKQVAMRIVEAHRSNRLELAIPSFFLHFHNWTRLLPNSWRFAINDSIGSGVESDLK